MAVTYSTVVIGDGNHASIAVPDEVLAQLGANRRAPLLVTVNGHSYQTTATGVGGECRVVFPQRERAAAGVDAGDSLAVTLELQTGYREVAVPDDLAMALADASLRDAFDALTYSRRRQLAASVEEAKAGDTRQRRITKVVAELNA